MLPTSEQLPQKGSDFVYIEACPDDFLCGICKHALFKPEEMECSHAFCQNCIREEVEVSGPVCPVCKTIHSKEKPTRPVSRILADYLGKLRVRCVLKSGHGECGAEYNRADAGEHIMLCEYRYITCPKKCGTTLLRGELRSHESLCAKGTGAFRFGQTATPDPMRAHPSTLTEETPPPCNEADKVPFVAVLSEGLPKARKARTRNKTPQTRGGVNPFNAASPSWHSSPRESPAHVFPSSTPAASSVPPPEFNASAAPEAQPQHEQRESSSGTEGKEKKETREAATAPTAAPTAAPTTAPAAAPTPTAPLPTPSTEADTADAPQPQPQPQQQVRTSKKLKIKGDDAYEQGNYDQAISYWSKALDCNDGTTKPAVVYGNRSAARFMSQQYKSCIEDCRRALREDQANAKLWSRMGKASCSMGDVGAAIQMLQEAIMSDIWDNRENDLKAVQGDADLCKQAKHIIDESTALVAQKKYQEAEKKLLSIHHRCNEWPEYILCHAGMLLANSELAAAADAADRLISVYLKKPTAVVREVLADGYAIKARATYMHGYDKMREAIAITKEGLVHVPNMQRLTELCQRFIALEEKKERGNERFKNKEWSNSAKLYTEGIALATDCPNCSKVLYTNRAAARKEMKQLLPAQEDCTAAIKLDPSFTRAYTRRGRCYIELGDFEKAITDFKSAQKCGANSTETNEFIREAERRRDSRDFYSILGLQANVNLNDDKAKAELKSKYRTLCFRWHPDKVQEADQKAEAEKRFKQVAEAYNTISDPAKRMEYDRQLRHKRSSTAAHYNYGSYHAPGGFHGSSRHAGGYYQNTYGGFGGGR